MSELTRASSCPPPTVTLTGPTSAAYAAASGDSNPIHADDAAAAGEGLPGVVAHGMLTLGRPRPWSPSSPAGRPAVSSVPGSSSRSPYRPRVASTSRSKAKWPRGRRERYRDIELTVTARASKELGMAKARVRPSWTTASRRPGGRSARLATFRVGGPATNWSRVERRPWWRGSRRRMRPDRRSWSSVAGPTCRRRRGFPGGVVRIASRGLTADVSDCGGAYLRIAAGEPWDEVVARRRRGLAGHRGAVRHPGHGGATPAAERRSVR